MSLRYYYMENFSKVDSMRIRYRSKILMLLTGLLQMVYSILTVVIWKFVCFGALSFLFLVVTLLFCLIEG